MQGRHHSQDDPDITEEPTVEHGPTCFAGKNGKACSNNYSHVNYSRSNRHCSPIRREPRYLAKPCKNTGFSAKPDELGKLAASETGGVLVQTKWGFWFGHVTGIFRIFENPILPQGVD